MMKTYDRIIVIALLLAAAMTVFSACKKQGTTGIDFPVKPIKIVVYTGPGGLIDFTARKFTDVAARYTDATFVVENKPGAGGLVAMRSVLQQSSDGYTLFACTKSNIAKIVASRSEPCLAAINWCAMLMADPECVITNRNLQISTWEQVVEDARKNEGNQIWVGPAMGGLDHVMALKVWEKYSLTARWIPFKSGGKAKAALLGGQGVAYVGNPGDVQGITDLKVAAVSSRERLVQFPDTPTFDELGMKGLDGEFMWRGFALKAGTPPGVLTWYDDLFKKVTADEDWREFWGKSGIRVLYYGTDRFTEIVQGDREEFAYYLGKIGILQTAEEMGVLAYLAGGWGVTVLGSVLVLINLTAAFFLARSRHRKQIGEIMIPFFLISLCLLFLLVTFVFPPSSNVGPAVVPRLWVAVLVPLNLFLAIQALVRKPAVEVLGDVIVGSCDASAGGEPHETVRSGSTPEQEDKAVTIPGTRMVFVFTALLLVYLLVMSWLGYFISSFFFVFLGMYLLGYRRYVVSVPISLGWILLSYLVFYRLLYVPLPTGKLFEIFF